ncbi:MAG: polysaccharide deacetylase family protein [Flavobacteriaceae bacterium]|nr:polysaccharide deacetylase family protein [Flavobacteriaceae bacterium]
MNKCRISLFGIILLFVSCTTKIEENIGQTVITKWQGNKQSAISITYDDGIINQFTVARPIMNKFGLPGTFFIITGKVTGSGKGKFIGRPEEDIIKESVLVKTNSDNFFERASLIGFTGTSEALEYHSEAGSLFESGNITEAYELIDKVYLKLRSGDLKNTDDVIFHNNPVDTTSWNDLKAYTAEGHEIASHTVTHPRLAVLDEVNLLYELEQSKSDIQKFLGEKYTFSAECPYGTENERVMEYAHKIYPALRNRMPESYLDELNRASKRQPGKSEKEYVQWQRGPLTNVSMEIMKSWVDTCIKYNNIWLVLVFHGIDGIGWEPKTGDELEEYFSYINKKGTHLWIATFADVTKYIRERKNAIISSMVQDNTIVVNISSDLDPEIYDVPVTLKTYVPKAWKSILLNQKFKQENELKLKIQKDELGSYVLYSALPNEGELILKEK